MKMSTLTRGCAAIACVLAVSSCSSSGNPTPSDAGGASGLGGAGGGSGRGGQGGARDDHGGAGGLGGAGGQPGSTSGNGGGSASIGGLGGDAGTASAGAGGASGSAAGGAGGQVGSAGAGAAAGGGAGRLGSAGASGAGGHASAGAAGTAGAGAGGAGGGIVLYALTLGTYCFDVTSVTAVVDGCNTGASALVGQRLPHTYDDLTTGRVTLGNKGSLGSGLVDNNKGVLTHSGTVTKAGSATCSWHEDVVTMYELIGQNMLTAAVTQTQSTFTPSCAPPPASDPCTTTFTMTMQIHTPGLMPDALTGNCP